MILATWCVVSCRDAVTKLTRAWQLHHNPHYIAGRIVRAACLIDLVRM